MATSSTSTSPDLVKERLPLLQGQSTTTSTSQHGSIEQEAAVPAKTAIAKQTPVLQLIIICIFRMTQPMFFVVVAPFINRMLVEDLKVSDEIHVGRYSGLVESVAAIGMCIGVFICSHLSDKYGRKPVILTGVGLSCILCAAFGFARQYWLLVVVRFAMGFAISAQCLTSRVMISEMSDLESLAQNFVYASIAWQIGATLGPTFGGCLAKPAETWPSVFRDTIFDTFPYALPTVAAATIPGLAVLVGIFCLDETKTASKMPLTPPSSVPPSSCAKEDNTFIGVLLAPWRKVRGLIRQTLHPTNGLPALFSCGAHYMMLVISCMIFIHVSLSITELLFLFSSPSIGGIGLVPTQLALYCAIKPLAIFVYEMFAFIHVSKIVGGRIKLFKIVVWLYAVVYLIYLAMSQVALGGRLTPRRVVGALATTLTLQVIANSCWLCCEVLIASRAPTSEQLSTILAMMEVIAQIVVGSAAAFSSSLFAESAAMHDGFFRFKLVWIVLFGLAIGTGLIVMRITHIDGWKEKQQQQAEEAEGDVVEVRPANIEVDS